MIFVVKVIFWFKMTFIAQVAQWTKYVLATTILKHF